MTGPMTSVNRRRVMNINVIYALAATDLARAILLTTRASVVNNADNRLVIVANRHEWDLDRKKINKTKISKPKIIKYSINTTDKKTTYFISEGALLNLRLYRHIRYVA